MGEPQTIKHTGCCDPFDPKPWEEKEITWQDKNVVLFAEIN